MLEKLILVINRKERAGNYSYSFFNDPLKKLKQKQLILHHVKEEIFEL